MRLTQTIRLGAWSLIALNFLMAMGSIWIFVRMAPVINGILEQNERSLLAGQQMLTCLAKVNGDDDRADREQSFAAALARAQNNVTEKEEPAALRIISAHYADAFADNPDALTQTIDAITRLSEINRSAMKQADHKAVQLGNAGAWGIVFMAVTIFMVGLIFVRALKRTLINPVDEIHSVITAFNEGDNARRCTGVDISQDFRTIFNGINELLDKTM
ncbi:MAG: hypothetical protein EOM20_06850 [Spartobacteria bacterium]|nr:hypothetical protein [Spartobacteria bacterium]